MKFLWQLLAYVFIAFWLYLGSWTSSHRHEVVAFVAIEDDNHNNHSTIQQRWNQQHSSPSWPMEYKQQSSCRLFMKLLLLGLLMAFPVYKMMLFIIGWRLNHLLYPKDSMINYEEVSLPLSPQLPLPIVKSLAPKPPPRRRRRCAPQPPTNPFLSSSSSSSGTEDPLMDPYQNLRRNLRRALDGLQQPLPPPLPEYAPLVWLPPSHDDPPEIAIISRRKKWLKVKPKWLRLFLERFKTNKSKSQQLSDSRSRSRSRSRIRSTNIISHLWERLKSNRSNRKAALYEPIDTLTSPSASSSSVSSSFSSGSSYFYV